MSYTVSSATGSLTAGQSRTFDVRPGMSLTLIFPPNCRATVTETPLVVSPESDRSEPLNQRTTRITGIPTTRTMGPYSTGANVTVAVATNSGAAAQWSYNAHQSIVIVSDDAPVDADGRPDGTIYIQTGA